MSTLGCTCGHTIKDNKYPLSTEGKIICQEDTDQIYSNISQNIAQFMEAMLIGERNSWVTHYFGLDYPLEIENTELIHDIILKTLEPTLTITQCENCGRLWIQDEPYSIHYHPFKPEDDWKGIIKGRIEKF